MKLHTLPALVLAAALPSAAFAQDCDRACLRDIADAYVASIASGDASQAPLADGARIVENLSAIAAGEGIWQAASAAPQDFRIYVPDVTSQQIGYMFVLEGDGAPIQAALRLKVEDRRIVEAEHVVVHSLRDTALPNLQQPRVALSTPVPEPYRDSRARLLAIGMSYYDALDLNNGALAPFADDCVRMENGLQTTRNPIPRDPSTAEFGILGGLGCEAQLNTQLFAYITGIDNRRVEIADEETGLVFGLSHLRHAMERNEFPILGVPGMEEPRVFDYAPFDMPAVHIYKIWGGQIHEIEALGVQAPYNSPTGWED